MSEALSAFRRRVARRVGGLVTLTTSGTGAADGSTAIAVSANDYFPNNDDTIDMTYYSSGSSAWRRISDYVASSGTFTFGRPFDSQQGSAATDYVFTRFTPFEIDEALRMAIEEVYPVLCQIHIDENTTLSANVYEVTFPTLILDIEPMWGGRIDIEENSSVATYPWRQLFEWTTMNTEGLSEPIKILVISPNEHIAGRKIRITGTGMISFPSTESTVIYLDTPQLNLLAIYTCAVLYRNLQYSMGSEDLEVAMVMEKKFMAEYERYKNDWGSKLKVEAFGHQSAQFPGYPLAYNNTPSA